MPDYYQRVEVVIRHSGPRVGMTQMVVRDAVEAAGYEIVWSGTSAACPTCEGRGYVNVQQLAPESCLAISDTSPSSADRTTVRR